MLETASLARAYALAQSPAHTPRHAHAPRKTGLLRKLRVQWRRLRRVMAKPGRAIEADAIPRLS